MVNKQPAAARPKGRRSITFFENCYIFAYMRPKRSGIGAIDKSYPPEHVFDPYCTLEVLRKFFMDKVWAVHPQKTYATSAANRRSGCMIPRRF